MQLQDKLVDGVELAHAESQQREDVLVHGEDRLPEAQVEALPDTAMQLRGQLLGAVRMLLDGQTLEVSQLHVPQREERALEALQAAVEGKSSRLGQFVYAEDRRDLLEQALAVLQPSFTHADEQTAHELHAQFADLADRVGELRHRLTDLEDAQDELLEGAQKALEKGDAEPSDKPKPKPSDPDAPRPATTLTGPDRPEPARPATTLTGPERPEPKKPATTLAGPDQPEPKKPPTTLTGPDLPEPKKPATTLTGPDLPPEPPAPSTLGDGTPSEDPAAKAKRPWWKRPFG